MRRLAIILLIAYATLPVIVILRASTEARFPLWASMLMPLVGFAFAILSAGLTLGRRRGSLLLGLTILISLVFESLSVAYGWIYGPYHYSPTRLGPLFLDLVPYVVPLSWFMMIYPSFLIARRLIPEIWAESRRVLALAGVGGLIMVSWDLVLDPVMTARGLWTWEVEGLYFDIPLQNYWGWWLTAFLILVFYQLLSGRVDRAGGETDLLLERLAVISYAVTGVGNIAEAWQLGLLIPAFLGLLAMAPWVILGWQITIPYPRIVP
jgi:putative membrane protein